MGQGEPTFPKEKSEGGEKAYICVTKLNSNNLILKFFSMPLMTLIKVK